MTTTSEFLYFLASQNPEESIDCETYKVYMIHSLTVADINSSFSNATILTSMRFHDIDSVEQAFTEHHGQM